MHRVVRGVGVTIDLLVVWTYYIRAYQVHLSANPYHTTAGTYDKKLQLPIIKRFREAEQQTLRGHFARAIKPGWEVLDLGCGNGFYTSDLVQEGARVTAVDGSKGMLDLLRERFKGNLQNVVLLQADVNTFEPGRQYDAVVSIGLMDYLPQWKQFLDKAFDSSKSAVILSCPAASLPGFCFKLSAVYEGSRIQLFSRGVLTQYLLRFSNEWDFSIERVGVSKGVVAGLTWIICATRKNGVKITL